MGRNAQDTGIEFKKMCFNRSPNVIIHPGVEPEPTNTKAKQMQTKN